MGCRPRCVRHFQAGKQKPFTVRFDRAFDLGIELILTNTILVEGNGVKVEQSVVKHSCEEILNLVDQGLLPMLHVRTPSSMHAMSSDLTAMHTLRETVFWTQISELQSSQAI